MYGQKFGRKLVKPHKVERSRNGQKRENEGKTMLERLRGFIFMIQTTGNTKNFTNKARGKMWKTYGSDDAVEKDSEASWKRCARAEFWQWRGVQNSFSTVLWNLMDLRDNEQNHLQSQNHEDHTAGKRITSIRIWCTSLCRFRSDENSGCKSLPWTRNGRSSGHVQHGIWKKSKSKEEVILEAQRHWWTHVTSKMRSIEHKLQKYKGRVVLRVTLYVDRYTCRTPHFHMYSHCTDHTAQMTLAHGSSLSCVPQNASSIHASCSTLRLAAHWTPALVLSRLSLSCYCRPRLQTQTCCPRIHLSIVKIHGEDSTSTEFHTFTSYEPKTIELNKILVKPQSQITDDPDDTEEIGVKLLSYSQSLVHSASDSAESIATPPDSGRRRRAIT